MQKLKTVCEDIFAEEKHILQKYAKLLPELKKEYDSISGETEEEKRIKVKIYSTYNLVAEMLCKNGFKTEIW